jgi:putative transcriptional regulator
MARRAMNRIKIVLIEKKRNSKWLAIELGVTHTTVSRWCTNLMQPSLEKLYSIADVLDVDVRKLLEPNKRQRE